MHTGESIPNITQLSEQSCVLCPPQKKYWSFSKPRQTLVILKDVERMWLVWRSPQSHTSSKCKKEALVRVFFQQLLHPPSHSLISLVDELLTEVAVYLLGSNTLMGWQCSINEIWDLRQKETRSPQKRAIYFRQPAHTGILLYHWMWQWLCFSKHIQ